MATREDTVEMIKVMQAYEDGVEIEWSSFLGGAWHSAGNPTWDWSHYTYRIKKQPRDLWLVCLPEGVALCHDKETAENKCCKDRFPIIHVREVLDE